MTHDKPRVWDGKPAAEDGQIKQCHPALVKDDAIEWKLGRFQGRADRERTHHQARLESDESMRHTSEKLSQRQVSLLLVDFGGVARLVPPATLDVPRLRSLRSSRAEGVSTSDHTASPGTPQPCHASTSKAARAGLPSHLCSGVALLWGRAFKFQNWLVEQLPIITADSGPILKFSG